MGESIAEVAAGLSGQMRAALTWPKEPRLMPNNLYPATINALIRRDLAEPWTYALTEKGRQVRNHLISQGADHDR